MSYYPKTFEENYKNLSLRIWLLHQSIKETLFLNLSDYSKEFLLKHQETIGIYTSLLNSRAELIEQYLKETNATN